MKSAQAKYRYYKCIGAKRKRGCGRRKGIKKGLIENFVFSHIVQKLMDDELIEQIIDIAMKEQGKENTALPALKKQLSDINKSIENLLDAIQNGIFTPSTKERLAKLEAGKEEIEVLIAKEEISKPIIPRECIRYWLYELRKLNMESLEARKFLINTFLNSVVVFKDKIEFAFNYREGTETVPFDILVSISDTYYGTPPNKSQSNTGSHTRNVVPPLKRKVLKRGLFFLFIFYIKI